MTPPLIVLIEGTWGGEWARPGSPFRVLCRQHGFEVGPQFSWSGDVSGVPSIWASRKHSDWRAGAYALSLYLAALPYEDRNIIAHSHGLHVALYEAAEFHVPIRRLLSICGPERKDMQDVAEHARQSIGYWLAVSAKGGDWFRRLGQAFDGRLGWKRRQPHADVSLELPDIGHTGLLEDPRLFDVWANGRPMALFDTFRASDAQIGARYAAAGATLCDVGSDVPGGGAA